MSKQSIWERIKSKFKRDKRTEIVEKIKKIPTEVKDKSEEILAETKYQLACQMAKIRIMVKRLRNRDKRKVPLFLLSYAEIEQLAKDHPLPLLPQKKD